jgi:hypothetical protein
MAVDGTKRITMVLKAGTLALVTPFGVAVNDPIFKEPA